MKHAQPRWPGVGVMALLLGAACTPGGDGGASGSAGTAGTGSSGTTGSSGAAGSGAAGSSGTAARRRRIRLRRQRRRQPDGEHHPRRDVDAGEGGRADVAGVFVRGFQRDDLARGGRARRARTATSSSACPARRRSRSASSAGRRASTTRRATTWARPARCRPACRCRRSRCTTRRSPARIAGCSASVENRRRLHEPLLLLRRAVLGLHHGPSGPDRLVLQRRGQQRGDADSRASPATASTSGSTEARTGTRRS